MQKYWRPDMQLPVLVRRCFGSLVFLLLLPINLAIGILLALAQGRPVLFVQERSGLHGKPFQLVKFRTMRDARDEAGALLPDAARITRLGNFLRTTRFDELPSFWNVACGDLAIVGPRPLLPDTIDALGDRGRERGAVLPGLTGWAQISGNTLLTLDEKVALDLHYVEARRWHTDLYIVVMTAWVMLAGEKRRHGVIDRNVRRSPPPQE